MSQDQVSALMTKVTALEVSLAAVEARLATLERRLLGATLGGIALAEAAMRLIEWGSR